MYDSKLETGSIVGGGAASHGNPPADVGTRLHTKDACVSTTIGTCTDAIRRERCVNTRKGTCSTTTTTSTNHLHEDVRSSPAVRNPVTGENASFKKSARAARPLIFVKQGSGRVRARSSARADDPKLGQKPIDLYTRERSSRRSNPGGGRHAGLADEAVPRT